MPLDWFAYYLPAMLIVAAEGRDARADNLRGLLYAELGAGLLRRRKPSAVARQLRAALTKEQWRLLQQFLVAAKHGKLPGQRVVLEG
jgi:hypothetical protein